MQLVSKPGKKMGLLLNHLLDAVIEDPTINKKEILLNIAKDINI